MAVRARRKVLDSGPRTDTRERILQVAQSLFAANGYHGASLREIATRVGIKAPSLLHHFASKRQLYQAVLDRMFTTIEEAAQGVLMGPGGYRERAHQSVEGAIDFVASHQEYARIIWGEFVDERSLGRQIMRRRVPPLFAVAQTFIYRGQRRNIFRREVDPFHFLLGLIWLILGYFAFAPMMWRLWNIDLVDQHLLEQVKRLVGDIVERTLFVDDSKDLPIGEDESGKNREEPASGSAAHKAGSESE